MVRGCVPRRGRGQPVGGLEAMSGAGVRAGYQRRSASRAAPSRMAPAFTAITMYVDRSSSSPSATVGGRCGSCEFRFTIL